MALSHFKNSEAAMKKFEVVNPSLFEVTILPPWRVDDNGSTNGTNLSSDYGSPFLLQHVRSIGGLDGVNPSVGVVAQKFKYAERMYAGGPDSTHLELSMTFSLNLNDSNENYIYTCLRKWCDYIYNPANGAMGLKSQYCGSMVILEYNRDGSIWRKITCHNVFPNGQMTGMGDRSYDDPNSANELSITFICDWWEEETVGLPVYE